MAKNGKNKSARKPLTEISNNRNPPKSNKKITKDEEDGALDRLLLAQSDLTNLIHQIDELVSQAFKHKLTCKMRNQEIESFTHVLSDMNSSLKSWVPRFQQAFSSPSTESVNHLASSLPINTVSAGNNERKNVHNISEELELDTLISPSPLVSWPTGCRIESGRQLFLLTPLPRSKVLSSKRPGSSRSVFEKLPNTDTPFPTLSLPPFLAVDGNSHGDRSDRVDVKSPKFFSKSDVTKTESTLEFGLVSPPPQFSNHKDHSMYLMTPLSKMSPLKTCMLLEPVSESLQQSNSDIPKLSTLAVRIQNCDDSPTPKSCNGEVSEVLSSKYSKLFGFLPLNHKSAIRREQIETSPDWFFSPPKTCILMEPPNDKLPINPAISDFPSSECPFNKQAIALFSAPEKKACDGCQSTKDFFNCELLSARLAAPENTPMLNGSESTLRTGKRPGENTLKRELWTKFEAVSTDALHFDASLFKETKGIGFLDRLEEEAFCEEMFLRPKSLR
ncbi:uncharacterized protein LOC143861431 isoform X1 [Tasmannia lanceolata]|uniref:uncharacterized protein LOC143861431 isoform X1 n=1 Tax=Tasmannia lanceolata TaxID=3420 RepID=UPI0040645B65